MSDDLLTVIQDIPFGSVHAYRVGDKISREAVEANNWQDYVATPSSKTAKNAVADATGENKEK